ncbi:MAG TPA: hypothetical protein GX390_06115 [Acholeplasmataceae bacterium]|jgi:hypothetical protein|nr:hypothetical protein [Acholeplasmataceae bacterium]
MIRKTTLPLIFGLVFLFLLVTIASFSFWDKLTAADETKTITLGSGVDLIVEQVVATPPDGKQLVPKDAFKGINDVDEIVLSYNVKLSKQTLNDLPLEVTAENVTIGNSAEFAHLVNIEIEKEQDAVNADKIAVTVKVSLNNPGEEEVYEQIKGKAIKFELRFTAKPA